MALISCKKESISDYSIISGKILNNTTGELTFNSADRSLKKVIKVNDDGSFSDTVSVKKDTYILYDGENRTKLYVENGNHIIINYDKNSYDETLAFLGEGYENSSYLFAKEKLTQELVGEGTAVYELNEDEYKAKFKEVQTSLEELLFKSKGVSADFNEKEKRNLNYGYLNKVDIYELYHGHYTKQPDFKISEGFLNDLEGLVYDNEEDFLFSSDYQDLVTTYYTQQAEEMVKKDSIAGDIAYLKVVNTAKKPSIKNSLLYENAKYGITYTEDLEGFYNLFMSASSNENQKKEITESYTKLKTVSKGQVSPKFVGYENFKGGTTSLDDLKGKYVYVDVWATWCGPCKAEIPSLKEVEKKYHNKNISFVSISVDKASDHEKWRNMVEEKELSGIQLFADKDWSSDFVEGYLIKGIPRFILIDPNGNIVNYNAPRPSEEKLIRLFNELKI